MRNSHIILGGTGFIGRHVCRALVARGDSVKVVGRTGGPSAIEGAIFAQLNISTASIEEILCLIKGIDVVHHYAWSTIPQTANINPVSDLYQNVGSTLKLLEAAKRLGGKRIIFASSGGTVYGKLNTIPADESHKPCPVTAYGISKLTSENYLNFYRSEHGVDIRIARISNPYGPGQNSIGSQGVISTFVYNALFKGEIKIFGDGTIVRDFIHIQDLTNALVTLSKIDLNDSDLPRTYNIGGGNGTSIIDVVESLRRAIRVPFDIKMIDGRAFDVPINVLNVGLAEKYLNWKPSISLDTGIKWMIEDLSNDKYAQLSSWRNETNR